MDNETSRESVHKNKISRRQAIGAGILATTSGIITLAGLDRRVQQKIYRSFDQIFDGEFDSPETIAKYMRESNEISEAVRIDNFDYETIDYTENVEVYSYKTKNYPDSEVMNIMYFPGHSGRSKDIFESNFDVVGFLEDQSNARGCDINFISTGMAFSQDRDSYQGDPEDLQRELNDEGQVQYTRAWTAPSLENFTDQLEEKYLYQFDNLHGLSFSAGFNPLSRLVTLRSAIGKPLKSIQFTSPASGFWKDGRDLDEKAQRDLIDSEFNTIEDIAQTTIDSSEITIVVGEDELDSLLPDYIWSVDQVTHRLKDKLSVPDSRFRIVGNANHSKNIELLFGYEFFKIPKQKNKKISRRNVLGLS